MTTKYSFDTGPTYDAGKDHFKPKYHASTTARHHRRTSSTSEDPTDGAGSLTYSAASSIHSGAGESTDSSFADILRVLDVQDSKELAGLLRANHSKHRDERSVLTESSLAYSTDAESHLRSLGTDAESELHGTALVGTSFTGQPSDQHAYDSGGRIHGHVSSPAASNGKSTRPVHDEDQRNDENDEDLNILFAPAEHADSLKRRKEKKRRERNMLLQQEQQQQQQQSQQHQASPTAAATPRAKNTSHPNFSNNNNDVPIREQTRSHLSQGSQRSNNNNNGSPNPSDWNPKSNMSPHLNNSPRSVRSHGSGSNGKSASTTPQLLQQRPPRSSNSTKYEMAEDDDVWYVKWWMLCFPDAHVLSPKR